MDNFHVPPSQTDDDLPTDEDPVTDDDPPPVPSACNIRRDAWNWSTPVELTDFEAAIEPYVSNPTYAPFDPTMSEDGRTLFVSTDARNTWDVWFLTRPSVGQPFDTAALAGADINAPGVNNFGYQQYDSIDFAMAFGDFLLPGNDPPQMRWVIGSPSSRPYAWTIPAAENGLTDIQDARATRTGLTVVYAQQTTEGRRLMISTRASLTSELSVPVPIDNMPPGDVSAPWLSPNELVLMFAVADDGTGTNSNIYVADRATKDEPFGNVAPLTAVNSDYFDGEPYVFEGRDTCELYIVSMRPAGARFRLFRSVL